MYFTYNSMKKIILILIAVFLTTNVYAHSTKGVTPNFDYNQNCTKKRSVLNYISKHKLYKKDKKTDSKKNCFIDYHEKEYEPDQNRDQSEKAFN